MENQLNSVVTVTRIGHGERVEVSDHLAVEEPLQIQLLFGLPGKEQQKNLAVTMRTPGNDKELAAGFLFTEGIIEKKEQLIRVIAGASGENTVLAILYGQFIPNLQTTERNFYMSSSCGVCGKSSIDAIRTISAYPVAEGKLSVPTSVLQQLPAALRNEQLMFKSTGGLHACALFDNRGTLLMLREDVGRHNALDKLIGSVFLTRSLPQGDVILLLSGRASFELVQKAAVAGITIIAAIGAPSSLAVQLALQAGITLIGFLKHDRFNIYSFPERITELTE